MKKEVNENIVNCYISQIGACILKMCHITIENEGEALCYEIGVDYLGVHSNMSLQEVIIELNKLSDDMLPTKCIKYIMTSKIDVFKKQYIYTKPVIVYELLPEFSLKIKLFRNTNLAQKKKNRIKYGNAYESADITDFSHYSNDFIYICKLLKMTTKVNSSRVSAYLDEQLSEFAILCGAGYVYQNAYESKLAELQALPEKLANIYMEWGFINVNNIVGYCEEQIILVKAPKNASSKLCNLMVDART